MTIKHWWNRHFSKRRHFVVAGKAYVQEGRNLPEGLLEHLEEYHPKEYAAMQNIQEQLKQRQEHIKSKYEEG